MKKLLIKFFLLLTGTILAFIIGEIILRERGVLSLGQFNTYDKKTGLTILPPNSVVYQKDNCIDNVVRANSQGFHDNEFSLDKPDNVFRIAILGDSFIEARQVPIEKSMQYLLEQKLNELPRDKKIEIYSFGKGGTGTFMHYLYLNQYVLKYKPDLVIMAFLPANDFRDDYEVSSEIFDGKGQIKTKLSTGQKLITKSVLLMWLQYKWQVIKTNHIGDAFRRVFLAKNSTAKVPFDFQVFLKDYPESWQKIWDLEEKLITGFKNKVEENKGKFMLVSINDIWRTNPELLEKNTQLNNVIKQFDLDFNKPENKLAEIAKADNFPYLNLMPIFRERVKEENKMIFVHCADGNYDGHWNEIGNAWAAEFLFNFLTKDHPELITK